MSHVQRQLDVYHGKEMRNVTSDLVELVGQGIGELRECDQVTSFSISKLKT